MLREKPFICWYHIIEEMETDDDDDIIMPSCHCETEEVTSMMWRTCLLFVLLAVREATPCAIHL